MHETKQKGSNTSLEVQLLISDIPVQILVTVILQTESVCPVSMRGINASVSCAGVYLQAQWFPADVPEQSWRGAQGVLGPFLQREDDSTWVLS